MPYDLIQGQGHGSLEVVKMADFKVYLLRWYACNEKTDGELIMILLDNIQILTG